jgi:type III secretion protein R
VRSARSLSRTFGLGVAVATLLLPGVAFAAPTQAPALDDAFMRPISLVVILALAALLPFAFMTLTAFVKISTVLQIVRGAIGAQNIPSSTVIMELAGALTLLAMAPVGTRIQERAAPLFEPNAPRDTTAWVIELARATREPIRDFLKANASAREKTRFFEIARAARPPSERAEVGRDDLVILVPAFVVSELIAAFALGFALYLPFLVIDLVVSNVLLALGMQMMNPTQVSLPFKLLLFVTVDGWGQLAQALVTGYRTG